MNHPAITVHELSKRYRLGQELGRLTFREMLMHSLPLSRRRSGEAGREEFVWALRDLSFSVEQGEVVGIIGPNGAGKSTLLKILSRITEPTSGHARILGRVGSLLEVGTGFHSELTGRENIFLNGALLGMRRAQVRRVFDQIVAFAEVDKFLDTPVKRYSSGMYMRLAFAVAAHLDTEVLLVDEVLAVGDIAFQKKCLARMGEIARGGRTVLFVSHNMSAINTLCRRCVLVRHGCLAMDGSATTVTGQYQRDLLSGDASASDLQNVSRRGSGYARFESVQLQPLGPDGAPVDALAPGGGLRIDLVVHARGRLPQSNVSAIIYDASGYRLVDIHTALKGQYLALAPGERVQVRFTLHDLLLKPERYSIGLWLGIGGVEEIDYIEAATSFNVVFPLEGARHTEVFPGSYQVRFESQTSPLRARDEVAQ